MSTLIDHHHLFKHRRPVESPKPADRPRRHGSRWLIAALAVSAAVVVTAIVAAQTGGESAQPAFQVPDLRGLDVIIYSGAPVNRAANDTSAFQVPDLRGLDVIYSGALVNRAASDTSATWYWWPDGAGLQKILDTVTSPTAASDAGAGPG